jgi:hypothetical protein
MKKSESILEDTAITEAPVMQEMATIHHLNFKL